MLTITIFDQEIKGMMVAIVSELIIGRRKFLKALIRNRRKVSGELRELRQDHGSSSHKAVNERVLTHLLREE